MITEIVKNLEREPCFHHFAIKRSKFQTQRNMVLDASPHSFWVFFMALVLEGLGVSHLRNRIGLNRHVVGSVENITIHTVIWTSLFPVLFPIRSPSNPPYPEVREVYFSREKDHHDESPPRVTSTSTYKILNLYIRLKKQSIY